MKVFKFGGASIKDATSVKNMSDIITSNSKDSLVIVVSAMGKTTNSLEKVHFLWLNDGNFFETLAEISQYHKSIIYNLYGKDESLNAIKSVEALFEELHTLLNEDYQNKNPDQLYDTIVSYGELLSSTIIAQYLNLNARPIKWIDARKLIRTDYTFREGKIDWEATDAAIKEQIGKQISETNFITQGFIGSTADGETTTLGREGSDFTAAILGASLNASSVTIWKDVPGILNADPKRFELTELYSNLSYQEAAEMTYYGASVIHPKTIKPLANKNIPLLVKSFEDPLQKGTVINQGDLHKLPPTFVVKDNQCLFSFGVKDLSFINEKNLSIIFHVLDKLNIKINMMQNSAVSLTICFDYREDKVKDLVKTLENDFKVLYNQDLQLITIKNYTTESIDRVSANKEILVEQRTRHTYQIVIK
jgi:aspartate kinase